MEVTDIENHLTDVKSLKLQKTQKPIIDLNSSFQQHFMFMEEKFRIMKYEEEDENSASKFVIINDNIVMLENFVADLESNKVAQTIFNDIPRDSKYYNFLILMRAIFD